MHIEHKIFAHNSQIVSPARASLNEPNMEISKQIEIDVNGAKRETVKVHTKCLRSI